MHPPEKEKDDDAKAGAGPLSETFPISGRPVTFSRVAYLVKAPRVGRSQGAVIFWGLVSAFFASAFCYYYLKNRTNEENARTLNDQVIILQGERDSLSSERDKIQAAAGDSEKQLRAREDFLQEKETKLAEEETQIESAGAQAPGQSANQAQASGVKRFDETVRKLVARTPNAEVVLRAGRPVLRLPALLFFGYGDAQLKPDGKSILSQAAQSLNGQTERFELRVETFTDSGGEAGPAPAPQEGSGSTPASATDPSTGLPAAPSPSSASAKGKSRYAGAWDLTGARAAAIAHYLRDQGALPFQDIIVLGRGDFQSGTAKGDNHSHDRRVEITLAPQPVPYHPPDTTRSTKAKPAALPLGPQPAPDTATVSPMAP